jgi:hypothetical protein
MGHFAFRLPLLDRITRLAFGEEAVPAAIFW